MIELAKANRFLFRLFTGILFFLLFTLANPPGIALAQVQRVLIIEHVAKEEKPKVVFGNDKITLHSAKTGKQHQGRITAFSDSSLVLGNTEFLLRDIKYIEGKGKVSGTNKVAGAVYIPVALVLTLFGVFAHGLDGPEAGIPFYILGAGASALSIDKLTRKADVPLGPETGWRFRIKTIK